MNYLREVMMMLVGLTLVFLLGLGVAELAMGRNPHKSIPQCYEINFMLPGDDIPRVYFTNDIYLDTPAFKLDDGRILIPPRDALTTLRPIGVPGECP